MISRRNKLYIILALGLVFSFTYYNVPDYSDNNNKTYENKIPLNLKGKKVTFPFYLYKNYGSIGNVHYFPTGRMGDYLTIRFWGNCKQKPFQGISCIKVVYDPVFDPEMNEEHWAGVFWLNPANNWGFIPHQGYDLRGATKLVFYARGEQGGEEVRFTMGGVRGPYPDSGCTDEMVVTLSKKWKRYQISLKGIDLSYIIGGFCWVVSYQNNSQGSVFYLDEIYYTDRE
ncbi:MAG: hypothetical protein JW827_03215 [Spirochaetes bacterium]|nr:hypothetical protein [Spirochaetota bacterium]